MTARGVANGRKGISYGRKRPRAQDRKDDSVQAKRCTLMGTVSRDPLAESRRTEGAHQCRPRTRAIRLVERLGRTLSNAKDRSEAAKTSVSRRWSHGNQDADGDTALTAVQGACSERRTIEPSDVLPDVGPT